MLAGGRSYGPGAQEFRAGSLLLAKSLNESGLGIQAEVHSGWPQDEKALDGAKAVSFYHDATQVQSRGWGEVFPPMHRRGLRG